VPRRGYRVPRRAVQRAFAGARALPPLGQSGRTGNHLGGVRAGRRDGDCPLFRHSRFGTPRITHLAERVARSRCEIRGNSLKFEKKALNTTRLR
jgi:hypothetical protein